MVTHTQKIVWKGFDGSVTTVEADGNTYEEAKAEALISAMAIGWKPPRWWQWWRWGDRDYTK